MVTVCWRKTSTIFASVTHVLYCYCHTNDFGCLKEAELSFGEYIYIYILLGWDNVLYKADTVEWFKVAGITYIV